MLVSSAINHTLTRVISGIEDVPLLPLNQRYRDPTTVDATLDVWAIVSILPTAFSSRVGQQLDS